MALNLVHFRNIVQQEILEATLFYNGLLSFEVY
jgi:hypothetical protein